jgi:hypothetical protein
VDIVPADLFRPVPLFEIRPACATSGRSDEDHEWKNSRSGAGRVLGARRSAANSLKDLPAPILDRPRAAFKSCHGDPTQPLAEAGLICIAGDGQEYLPGITHI